MKIKNKATGQVFEIADGALYPKNAYIEITTNQEQKEEPKVNPEPFIELPIEPEHRPDAEPIPQEPESVKKPAKKTRKRKSSKKSKSNKTTE